MIYEYLVIMADYNIANMSTPFPFILVLSYLSEEIYCFTKIYKYLHIKYIFRYTSNLEFHYN